MRLSDRNRKFTSALALTSLLVATTAAPTSAYYDAKTGRFLSVDPAGTGLNLTPSLSYNGASPVVNVNAAYRLQYADGLNLYEFVRSNPINRTDPTGLFSFSLPDLLGNMTIRASLAASAFAAAEPEVMRFAGGLLAAANLYAFAQYQEAQAMILAQPNPIGFLAGEAAALRFALQELTSTAGSITALSRASAPTQELVTVSSAFVRRSTLSFKPFTQRYFRENLGILTGGAREGFDAHHVFCIEFEPLFQAVGIEIHDPIYGAWWAWRNHQATAYEYNKIWRVFLRSKPNREQILQKGRELAQTYGFEIHF